MRFEDLGIDKSILRAIREMGYTEPTPIQSQTIRLVAEGRDVMGCAQTGTGKTAAFSIPILQRLGHPREKESRPVRVLILTPTRELALQIYENICQFGRYTGRVPAVIYGGVSQIPQVEAIKRGADVLVATPGRLWDLMGQGLLDIGQVECFVLDEADQMLDMGFIHDIRRIVAKLPKKRQTLLFSATIPEEIAELAMQMLKDPVRVSVAPSARPVELIEQSVYFVEKRAKQLLLQTILQQRGIPQTLVFVRTKHGADRVARDLNRAGISAKAIHGDKSQGARQTALAQFKAYKIAVLVATDIAARGIDINELPLVVNFDLPNVPETYVHRIGRTGRAGQEGTAVSFCDASEMPYLADIEKVTGIAVPAIEPPEGIAMSEASAAARYVANTAAVLKEAAASMTGKAKKTGKTKKNQPQKPNKKEKTAGVDARTKPGKAGNKQPEKSAKNPKKKDVKSEKPVEQLRARRQKMKADAKAAPAKPSKEPKQQKATKPVEKSSGRGRRSAYESDTRVDIATHTRVELSESTAARIRAKVEAKLAEREHHAAKKSEGTVPVAAPQQKKKTPAGKRNIRGRR